MDETVFFASLFFFFGFFFCQKSCLSFFQFFLLAGSFVSSRFFCRSKNNALAGSLVRVSRSLVLLGCYWLSAELLKRSVPISSPAQFMSPFARSPNTVFIVPS